MRPCTWNRGMTSSDRSRGVSSYVATMLASDAARFACVSGTPCAPAMTTARPFLDNVFLLTDIECVGPRWWAMEGGRSALVSAAGGN